MSPPRSAATLISRACQFCRARKIKCDNKRPQCGSCANHGRQCTYTTEPPRQRPSRALIDAAQEETRTLQQVLISLKNANEEDRNRILDSMSLEGGTSFPSTISLGSVSTLPVAHEVVPDNKFSRNPSHHQPEQKLATSPNEKSLTTFISRDETGKIRIFGPTSNLRIDSPTKDKVTVASTAPPGSGDAPDRYQLIANAALQRQREHDLRMKENIGGIPSELAMHLLDLHWNRQHHTYHLTYRPAFMRDLAEGGPYCSEFLLNAVFGCSSKFSERIEVREDPLLQETAGKMFFDRCDELIAEKSLLEASSIPTITGLLMLGATFNAKGRTSKGWLYVGYALRMVYDLGLHLDCKEFSGKAEDVEIRRRVFWGAFICDKLQSLYFGRPFMIQLQDAQVSWDLADTFEENEMWCPYIDPKSSSMVESKQQRPIRLYSITTFQRLCSLSRLMTSIVDYFYVVGATPESSRPFLDPTNERLRSWYQELPLEVRFEPWNTSASDEMPVAAPNVIALLTTYYSLVILLHRPFIRNGHLWALNTLTTDSWERCATAARNITSLALEYKSAYSLRRANYMLSYALYVACTIHARNPAVRESTKKGDISSPLTVCLRCLDELAVPNCGVSVPAQIVRKLMQANGIPDISVPKSNNDEILPLDFNFNQQVFPDTCIDNYTAISEFQPFIEDLDSLFGFLQESDPAQFDGRYQCR
ncbi:nitrogen assimilation transcription factor NirA [Talaromyces proteolyticus]|uniref:Nitrogen assimilation transcription factor NirA n=1 Tax=Talaromyces proteolyticus TaxID=1131652 RepID=A0AAD4PSN2_9EURO|nr:nitrogen assimilation transcription factor NirA [Talaromyces proteolyticus]KAH8691671.1 nitrogen assimilation transcription factor NirA [Talaromyces proteolyticus]